MYTFVRDQGLVVGGTRFIIGRPWNGANVYSVRVHWRSASLVIWRACHRARHRIPVYAQIHTNSNSELNIPRRNVVEFRRKCAR